MKKVLSFLILEDHSLVTNAIRSLLLETFIDCDIKCFKSVEEIESKITNFDAFDLLISDLSLETNQANGFLMTVKENYNLPILVISMHNSYRTISEVVEIGVDGYILKDDADFFHIAIDQILNGNTYFSPKVEKTLASVSDQNMFLTKRQLEIYTKWFEGKPNTQIAKELFISVETVKTHKRNIRAIAGEQNLNDISDFLRRNKII